jgi:hypothetical protein
VCPRLCASKKSIFLVQSITYRLLFQKMLGRRRNIKLRTKMLIMFIVPMLHSPFTKVRVVHINEKERYSFKHKKPTPEQSM